MATHDEASFLRTLLTPADNDGGQGLRSLFSNISGQAPPEVVEHQGPVDWNPLVAAALGTQNNDDATETDPSAGPAQN
ncbi:hypothetical protein [Mycobacterium sp.]|uniref:hypothetical protein n=1 Tax=Mycobacterium sp. TaxID=1785 RepID=UPI003BAF6BAB